MAKKVLIIEDEPDILKMIDFVLKKNNFTVISATDGPQGLDLFSQQSPDLVILDWLLPSMDALDVSEKIRNAIGQKPVPIILLTATAEDVPQKAKDCGASAYFLKPFDYKELVAKIKELIGNG